MKYISGYQRFKNVAKPTIQMTVMDTLRELWDIYCKCEHLLKVESKKDPETDPHRSKRKAIKLLENVKDLIMKELEGISLEDENFHSFKAALAVVLTELGIACHETEELSKAENFFAKGLDSMSDPLHSKYILTSIELRNHLGMLWYHRSQFTEAKKWLEEAENLYEKFKKQNGVPKQFFKAFDDEEEEKKKLELLHTMTKFYLAQVYRALNDFKKSAIYCHKTLKRELELKEYDPIDWALNSATLSQVFMEKGSFKQARHHLAAASYVLDIYKDSLNDMVGSQEEMDAKREELRHRAADVSRCWAKYGIFLIEHSKNPLSGTEEEEKLEDMEKLWFDSLDLSKYENQITTSDVVAFEDARELFLVTQKHLNKAKEYYTLEDRASDHVQVVQDHSQLFRHLAAFEPDEERQFKMMKKRVDMLEAVLKELNPRYYLDVCRQLWFELGETYHDMMQIKFHKVKDSSGFPAFQVLMKINALAESSATNFNHFLDSIKDKNTKELPDPIPEELISATLVAHFYLGRLYYKYITQDKRKQMENIKKAYDCFKYLVDNCEKNEMAKRSVGDELNISREMMSLLQMKALQL